MAGAETVAVEGGRWGGFLAWMVMEVIV